MTLLQLLGIARDGSHTKVVTGYYSTFVYMTQLQLFGRVGRAYNRGYYVRYPVTAFGEVAWTTNTSRGTS
jgi:hypothetical protein